MGSSLVQGWKIRNSEQFIVIRIPGFQTNSKGKLLDVFYCFNFALEVRIPSNCRIFQMGSNKAFVEPQQAGRVSASIKAPVEKPNKSAQGCARNYLKELLLQRQIKG